MIDVLTVIGSDLSSWSKSSAEPWRSKGLTVSDFSQTVDLTQVASKSFFVTDGQARPCTAVTVQSMTGRAWCFEVGVLPTACLAHLACELTGRRVRRL